MSYDLKLADRVRKTLAREKAVTERRMFGGISFLRNGKMFCGVIGRKLVVRVGPDDYARALSHPNATPMDFTGKPLRGFVYVSPGGYRRSDSLRRWVTMGLAYVKTIAKKEPG